MLISKVSAHANNTGWNLYIPVYLVRDSQFRLQLKDELVGQICSGGLLIRQRREEDP